MKTGEGIIAPDAEYSCLYARDVLKDRFPAGERAIAKDAFWSFWYAHDVLKGRFPAGEAAIATSACWSYDYALNVVKGRFPAGEAAIATSACQSFCYARNVIQGCFPEGEAAIAKSACWSYHYASDALKGRFHAGEAAVAASAYTIQYSAFLDSMALLRSCLTRSENTELKRKNGVTVRTSKGGYFVPLWGRIKGPKGNKFCVAFEDGSLPAGDLMLAKILLLKADPERLLAVACLCG
jgi:hypothetical protein